MLLRMRRQRSRAGYADIDLRPVPHCLYDFDNRYTAPLSGFRDADDYYGQSSAAPLLQRVAVPTTILASRDDPLVPPAPFHQAQLSDRIHLHLTRYGGHLGYLAAAGDDPDRRWMDWRVVQMVSAATGEDPPQ
jgi:predicted alpha/beta-fold hydrolase